MQIHITVLGGSDAGAEREVVVGAQAGATAADLGVALGLGARTLLVAGRAVPAETPVGMPPLLTGAVVSSSPDPLPRRLGERPPASPWELWVVRGPDEGLRFPLVASAALVGRSPDADVRLTDATVSRRHASIQATAAGLRMHDLAGADASGVNGIPLTSTAVRVAEGDVLEVGSTSLVVRSTPRASAAVIPDGAGHLRVSPAPTPRQHPPAPAVSFPDPLAPPTRSQFPLLALLVPLALAGLLSAVMHSPTMLLFGLSGPVLSLGTWVSERRGGSWRGRAARAAYHDACATAQARLREALDAETAALEAGHPVPASVLCRVETRSVDVWDRRAGDPDALVVRVGVGSQQSQVVLQGASAPATPLLPDVPITVDLGQVGVLGLCGPRPTALRAAAVVVTRLAAVLTPRDLEVVVLTDSPSRVAEWRWAALLPHAAGHVMGQGAYGPSVVQASHSFGTASTPPCARVLARLTERIDERSSQPGQSDGSGPHVLVVMDSAATLRKVPGVDALLRRGTSVGIHVLAIDGSQDRLPAESRAVLRLDRAGAHHAQLLSDGRPPIELVPDLPSPGWVVRMARGLAPLLEAAPLRAGGGLPADVRLLDLMTGPTDPDVLSGLTHRWRENPRTTQLVLGATADGPLMLDLATEGPHVLVAGTTGAGKSELLQTLVCSLALGNRPDEMSFVLLDYKGGAAFVECAGLPHVVGLVTDLDAHLTRRALVSLAAELRRRERLLAAAGASSLEDYQRRRDRSERDPPDRDPREHDRPEHEATLPRLARLCIVIDEFRVLAEELPDFVHGLVRLAAVGRSLGVHLILATQRPGGIVSADIRANVSLRIALRVRDRSDSVDVVEAADAATISASTPGRAFLRGAATPLTEFQTARVTSTPAPSRHLLTVTPQPPWWLDPPVSASDSRPSDGMPGPQTPDLAAIVAAARAATRALGIPAAAAPWLPPLPDVVDVAALVAPDGCVALGLADEPAIQRQAPWCWRLDGGGHLAIGGGPGSGRTGSLLAVAGALAAAYPPTTLHLYAIGAPSLAPLRELPHTAVTTTFDAPEHIALVVGRLQAIIRDRAARSHPEGPSWLVLLVDGWEQLALLTNGTLAADLRALLDSGSAAGLRAVVTGGRGVLAGHLASAMTDRLVLRVSDPVELAMAGIPAKVVPDHQPAGRAIDVRSHAEVQLGLLGTDPSSLSQAACLAEIASRWAQHTNPSRLPRPVLDLPQRVALADAPPAPAGLIALGVREGDHVLCGVTPARGQRRVLVLGPPSSGRTTTMATLARGLAQAGLPLAVVGRDLSALVDGRVLRIDPRDARDRDRLVELRRAHPSLAMLVDDAERVEGSGIDAVLQEIARLVDEDHGFIAVSTTPFALEARQTRLGTDLAAYRTGVVLGPAAGARPLGVTATSASTTIPGRGLLVSAGASVRIQVATAG